MDALNHKYVESIRLVQTADNMRDIEKALKELLHLRHRMLAEHPENIDSITDINYYIARGAYRVNNTALFEQTIQQHYYDDYRFKVLYQTFREMETANVWNNIVRMNALNLEKTFVRSLSVIILTGVCLSLVVRK